MRGDGTRQWRCEDASLQWNLLCLSLVSCSAISLLTRFFHVLAKYGSFGNEGIFKVIAEDYGFFFIVNHDCTGAFECWCVVVFWISI